LVFQERKKRQKQGMTSEESRLSKPEIQRLAFDNGLKVTPEEVEKLYNEQLNDEKMEEDEMFMGNGLWDEPLTRAEIENLMK